MITFYSMFLGCLWLRLACGEVSSSNDITQINNLSSQSGVSIDPRLRRALLRVLTRLEEEDRQAHTDHVMQNMVTEQDFIRYFQEHGLEKELVEMFGKPEDQKEANYDEILSYSSEDEKKNQEKPFTFASYPEEKTEDSTPPVKEQDFYNEKYPSTNPTPSLENAVYFQIPEPIHNSDSDNSVDNGSFNVQETRSIQGPTLVSPTEIHKFQTDKDESGSINEQLRQENLVSQENPPFSIIRVAEPEKIDLPKEVDEEVKTEVDFHASNGTEVVDTEDAGNSSMKVNLEKHEVEFLHSSLLAAFTVQQDQQGLPRRVIPLNYQHSGDPIPLPNNKEQPRGNAQNTLEDKQRQLELQVKFLQDQQLQEQQYQRLQEFVKERQRLLDEEAKRQQILENQKRLLENEQRLSLVRQRQQQILFQSQQPDNQLDNLKELERQRLYQQQQQHFQQQNFQSFQAPRAQPQNVYFQKSVDFQFQTNQQQPQAFTQSFQPVLNNFNNFQPSVELNRVNRHEPSNFIGNFGASSPQLNPNFQSRAPVVQNFVQPSFSQPSNYLQSQFQHRFAPPRPPLTVDGQLQSLFSISGLVEDVRGKPSGQEDLSIISKVLALNHGDEHNRQQRQQFQGQASTIHEHFVPPPSRVIEPPQL